VAAIVESSDCVPRSAPLSAYLRYETSDPRAAEDDSARLLSPHRLTVCAEGTPFSAVGRCADVGGVSLCYLSYGAEVTMDRPSQEDYVAILAPLQGTALVRHAGEEFSAHSSTIAAISPGASLHTRWSHDCRVLLLRADANALDRIVHQLAPIAPHEEVRLHASRVTGPAAAAIYGVMQLLTQVFDSYGPNDEVPGLVARQLREQALNTVVLSIPNTTAMRSSQLSPLLVAAVSAPWSTCSRPRPRQPIRSAISPALWASAFAPSSSRSGMTSRPRLARICSTCGSPRRTRS